MPGKRHDILILGNFAKKESFHIEYGHRTITINLGAYTNQKYNADTTKINSAIKNKATTTILGTTKIIFIKINGVDD